MSESIGVELQFFLVSVVWGVILLLIYDCLRIFRRILPHNSNVVAIEDILFWIVSGILIFDMMYEQNNGIIRGFSIMGMTIGMLLYNHLVSGIFVKGTSTLLCKIFELIARGLELLVRPVRWCVTRIKWALVYFCKKIKKILKNLLKRLKKFLRTVKILVSKK